MKRNKALKVRIYPNAKQTEQLNKTLGCSRAIYNMMLHERITVFEEYKDDRGSMSSKWTNGIQAQNSAVTVGIRTVRSLLRIAPGHAPIVERSSFVM